MIKPGHVHMVVGSIALLVVMILAMFSSTFSAEYNTHSISASSYHMGLPSDLKENLFLHHSNNNDPVQTGTVSNLSVMKQRIATASAQSNFEILNKSTGSYNSTGYVKYTLNLANGILYNGEHNSSNTNSYPQSLAYAPGNGKIYVAGDSSKKIFVIDPNTNHINSTISLSQTADSIIYAPSTGYLYAGTQENNTLSVINSANNTVVGVLRVGNGPQDMTYDPQNSYVYVSNHLSGNVTIVNTVKNRVIGSIHVGNYPYGIAYDPSNHLIYVADWGDGNISIINPSNNSVIQTLNVGLYPYQMLYNPSDRNIYVTTLQNLTIINSTTNTVQKTINLQTGYSQDLGPLAYDPMNGYIYVTNPNEILVLNSSSGKLLTNFSVGIAPSGTIYVPSNNMIYVVNQFDDSVTIISTFIPEYYVEFDENGLPSGSSWNVDLGGHNLSSNSNLITFVLKNGTYSVSIGGVNGYNLTSSAIHNISVDGNSLLVNLTFVGNAQSFSTTDLMLISVGGVATMIVGVGAFLLLRRKK